jgi:hypothetical protein
MAPPDWPTRLAAVTKSGDPNMARQSRLGASHELCSLLKEPIALHAANAYQEFKRRFEKWQW